MKEIVFIFYFSFFFFYKNKQFEKQKHIYFPDCTNYKTV